MKLPSEISNYETPFNIAFAEAIVRDCAKVADEHEFTHGVKDYTAEPVSSSILARYGLEPKK